MGLAGGEEGAAGRRRSPVNGEGKGRAAHIRGQARLPYPYLTGEEDGDTAREEDRAA